MYLVINLTVADMFVGGFCNLYLFRYRLLHCDITKRNFITLELANKNCLNCLFSVSSQASPTNIAVISLDRMHATIRVFIKREWSFSLGLHASRHHKWIYGALTIFTGFGCNFNNCHSDTCTIWGQEKNFRIFLPSSCGQSDLLRLNVLKKKEKKEKTC